MKAAVLDALLGLPRSAKTPSGQRVWMQSDALAHGVTQHTWVTIGKRALLVETQAGVFAVVYDKSGVLMSTQAQYDDPAEQREAVASLLRQMPWWVEG